MNDKQDNNDNKPRLSGKTLSLSGNKVDAGSIKQNFSQGKAKTVVVERKRKRIGASSPIVTKKPDAIQVKKSKDTLKTTADQDTLDKNNAETQTSVAGGLTADEVEARNKALAIAKERAAQEAEENAKRKIEEEKIAKQKELEEAEAAKNAVEEKIDTKEQEETKENRKDPAEYKGGEETTIASKKVDDKKDSKQDKQEEYSDKNANHSQTTPSQPNKKLKKPLEAERRNEHAPRRSESSRRQGKLTISNALEDNQRQRSLASMKRRREREKRKQEGIIAPQTKISREVIIPEVITIQELANRMAERAVDVIKFLMKQDQMLKINDLIDADTAQLIAEEMGHTVKRVSEADVEEGLYVEEDKSEDLKPRPPVVTVMGHVDHGKTSLLDAIRKTNVTSAEAGGITQHIGAYQVKSNNGEEITFIDTPGHAAFTEMRARGAKVTDIVILVVAADDGVMPQTIEAISHAKAAEVPIIVAINKIDKPGCDPNRVRNELLQHEVFTESMGGDVLDIEISAIKVTNIDKLLEAVILQAEILELQANPNRKSEGVIIEAKLDRGRGSVATVLVQHGTLKIGDIFVAGTEWGKIRALINDHGNNVVSAGPSVPVEVLGLSGTPGAGEQFAVVENEARAREITDYRQRKIREIKGTVAKTSLEQMMSHLKEGSKKELTVLVKADVQGSAEAIIAAFNGLGVDEVEVNAIHYGVGGITETDVSLAQASQAILIGFNVRATRQAKKLAEDNELEIRYYNVIYDLIDDIKAAMSGLLSPTIRETFLGNAEILEIFDISKVGKIAGCRVSEGMVQRGNKVRLIRDSVVIHEGVLSTLKRFKDEVKEVNYGQECGMAFENYHDMRKGDVIECFKVEEIVRTLD